MPTATSRKDGRAGRLQKTSVDGFISFMPLRAYAYCPGQRNNSAANYWNHNSGLDILAAESCLTHLQWGKNNSLKQTCGFKAVAGSIHVQTQDRVPSGSWAGLVLGFSRSDRLLVCCSVVLINHGRMPKPAVPHIISPFRNSRSYLILSISAFLQSNAPHSKEL